MAKIEGVIKAEIVRLAKREVRAVFRPLKREVWHMSAKLSMLSKACPPSLLEWFEAVSGEGGEVFHRGWGKKRWIEARKIKGSQNHFEGE